MAVISINLDDQASAGLKQVEAELSRVSDATGDLTKSAESLTDEQQRQITIIQRSTSDWKKFASDVTPALAEVTVASLHFAGELARIAHAGEDFAYKAGLKVVTTLSDAGTAAAKGRIFDLATAPSVLVMDCHVLLPSGVLAHLIKCLADNPDSKDLWQGPCIGDGGIDDIVGTHFEPRWGSLMYGQWGVNRESLTTGEPFEIEMQGCGLFCCHRHAWPGFHPLLKRFGPKEFHLHQRIRRNGGKCWSLPWLKWCHRFGNPDGTRPPGLHPEERLRGHLITHLDTRAPSLSDIRKHFVDDAKVMDNDAFFRVLRDTVTEFWADRQDLGQTCQHRQPFLQVVDCEIGCVATRAPLPVFSCAKHGQCAPWRWQQTETMQACVVCDDNEQD